MARYIDVNEVLRFAQEVFDTEPGPGSMQLILQAMYDTLTQVAQLRADLGDVTDAAWWERALALVSGGGPEKLKTSAEDRARLMIDWDRRANEFWERFEVYDRVTAAAQSGALTGEFTGIVVQGVLHGDVMVPVAEMYEYDVKFPDVIEPFRLWNELNQYAAGTSAGTGLQDWAQSVVERFGQSIKETATEGVEGMTQTVIDKVKAEADTYVNEARAMLKEEAEEAQAKVEAGIGIAIGIGVAALAVAFIATRRKKR